MYKLLITSLTPWYHLLIYPIRKERLFLFFEESLIENKSHIKQRFLQKEIAKLKSSPTMYRDLYCNYI